MKKKKIQAIKAIQYVMREKPTVFTKSGEVKKSSKDQNNTYDNVSDL